MLSDTPAMWLSHATSKANAVPTTIMAHHLMTPLARCTSLMASDSTGELGIPDLPGYSRCLSTAT